MAKKWTSGFTLVEMIVVVGIVILLATLSVPAYNSIIRDHRQKAIDTAVTSAFRAAQAHASQTQNYAGIRFQFARPIGETADDPTDPTDNDAPAASVNDWRNQRQYMVLIEADASRAPSTTGATVFLPVANRKTITVPPGFGVVAEDFDVDAPWGAIDQDDFNDDYDIMDHMTFSVVFGPNGQVVSDISVEVQKRDQDDTVFFYSFEMNNSIPAADRHLVDAPLFDDSDPSNYLWLEAEPPQLGVRTFEVEQLLTVEEAGGYAEAREDFFNALPLQILNIYTGQFLDQEDLK